MTLILKDVKIPVEADESSLKRFAARALAIRESDVQGLTVVRISLDARKKREICFNYTFRLKLANSADEQRLLGRGLAALEAEEQPATDEPVRGKGRRTLPVAVIGFGPAGIFAAYQLAKYGCTPVVFERGSCAAERIDRVKDFWNAGKLDAESNVMFGEGGAGTFSDGKLTTRIKDARAQDVVRILASHGAPKEILVQAKPHIGTDKLVTTVQNLRAEIINMGGEVRFNSKLVDLEQKDGDLCAVIVERNGIRERFACCACVLAIGQGARDTYELLYARGMEMKPKPFAVGVRIEHPRRLIDQAQFGDLAGHPRLGAAEYRLTGRYGERGVYTFCMCPGGVVVASSSAPEQVVTNGMSYFARDGEYSNAAIVVQVDSRDFGAEPLDGMRFQENIERAACRLGGGGYFAPAQRVEDYLRKRATMGFGSVAPTYKPGVTPCNLYDCLPDFVAGGIEAGIRQFAGKLKGFDYPDAVITAVESRTSAPLRILRNENGEATRMKGLYPVGEGAGYAGGIVSAAVDGMKAAEAILALYRN